MFSVAVARLGGEVVALDASLYNLAYVRRSLELNSNLDNVKLVYNSIRWVPGEVGIYTDTLLSTHNQSIDFPLVFLLVMRCDCSDEYSTYYPYTVYKPNPGGTEMLTLDQLRERNVTADYVGLTLHTRAVNEPSQSLEIHGEGPY